MSTWMDDNVFSNIGQESIPTNNFTHVVNDVPYRVENMHVIPMSTEHKWSILYFSDLLVNILTNLKDKNPDSTWKLHSWTEPAHGQIYMTSWGEPLGYIPYEKYVGADSFTYTIIDCNGEFQTISVHIKVDPNYTGTDNGSSAFDYIMYV